MTPKIDYKLLGEALAEYENRGYTYVEVPWSVEYRIIRATLPPQYPAMTIAVSDRDGEYYAYDQSSHLVGSAEQGFLALNLAPGAYVGVSPCFRPEPVLDLLHQNTFVKIELFVKLGADDEVGHVTERVLVDAGEVMSLYTDDAIYSVQTAEGYDLELGGIEVGSYGERTFDDQRWVYGTGLALPRFSVAGAIASIT